MNLFLDSLKCLKTVKIASKWWLLVSLLVSIIYSHYVLSVATFEKLVYVEEFEECLNLRNSIPNNHLIKFNVTKVNNHIEILVHQDDIYDYYEMNAIGDCFTAVRQVARPIRTLEEQMQCDSTSRDNEHFKCGYEVIKNVTHAVVLIHGIYEYIIDRTNGIAELYRIDHFVEAHTEKVDKCINRKHTSDFNLPLEVTKKSTNSDYPLEIYVEIWIKFQGKYDLYVAADSGYVNHIQRGLQDKTKFTLSDESSEIQCSLYGTNAESIVRPFRCPLKVIENENFVNISVISFHNEHRYVIDKVSNDMKYIVVEDTRYVAEANRNHNADIDKCVDKINNNTYPFPVEVRRNKDYVEIWVEFNNTFDLYETIEWGDEICEISNSIQKPTKHVWKSLAQVYTHCLSCAGPEIYFSCPAVNAKEEKDAEMLQIQIEKGLWYEYRRIKSSGEISTSEWGDVFYASGGVSPTLLKSLIG